MVAESPATPTRLADRGAVGFAHDALGRRTSMTDPTGTTTYAYDTAGRLASTTTAGGRTLGFGYDPAGNRTSLTYPDAWNHVSAGRKHKTPASAGVSQWQPQRDSNPCLHLERVVS